MPTSRRFGLALVPVALAAAGVALLAGIVSARYGDSAEFHALLAGATVAGVAIWTLVREHRRSRDAFSPLGLSCIFYLATFSLGALYAVFESSHPLKHVFTDAGMVQAIWAGALGLAGLIAGYRLNILRAVTAVLPRLPNVRSERAGVVVAVAAAVGWVARGAVFASGNYFYAYDNEGPAAEAAPGLFLMLAILPTFAVAYCGARYNFAMREGNRDEAAVMRRWFYGLMAIEIAYHAPRGTRAAFLTLILMVVVLRYYGLRKRPSLAAITSFVLVAVLVLFPVLFSLRNEGQGSRAYEDNLGYAAERAVTGLVQQSPLEAVDAGVTATLERFSGATSVGAIYQCDCPPPRPPGTTIAWIAPSLVPIFEPLREQPSRFGYVFGRHYGISDYSGIALTQVGEMWLNYEWIGVFLGLVFVGALYRVIGDYYRRRDRDPLALAIYATFAWTVINTQETVVAAGVVGLVRQLIVITVLVYGLTWLVVAGSARRGVADP